MKDERFPAWALCTDWGLLRKQKQALTELSYSGVIKEDLNSYLIGLLSLLDAIQDWAEDNGIAENNSDS